MSITLFALHFLGGSSREFDQLANLLHKDCRIQPIDLPGFGSAAQNGGYAVGEMSQYVSQRICSEPVPRWAILGHSMGAKVAAVIARRAEDGEVDLRGCRAVIQLSGSPPSPEPIEDDKRQTMLSWFHGRADGSRREAMQYIERNVAQPLPSSVLHVAVDDVLRCNHAAWAAWLESGSREDWSERVGILQTPALIIAGSEDAALGPAAQRRLMAPHFAQARQVTLQRVGHLSPLESPGELASSIRGYLRTID